MSRAGRSRRAAQSAGAAVVLVAGATAGIVAADLEHALPADASTAQAAPAENLVVPKVRVRTVPAPPPPPAAVVTVPAPGAAPAPVVSAPAPAVTAPAPVVTAPAPQLRPAPAPSTPSGGGQQSHTQTKAS